MNIAIVKLRPLLWVVLLLPALVHAGGDEFDTALRAATEAARQATEAATRAAASARAANQELAQVRQQMARLQTRLTAQEAELRKYADAQGDKPSVAAADLHASGKGGALKFASEDGYAKYQIGGRIMADTALFNDDASQLGNGAELRRARVFVAGTVFDHWQFKGQYDFAGNQVSIKDAYLRYNGWPVQVTLGNHHEPFGLEELTSSKYITFMERGLPGVFAPSRNFGVSAGGHGERWSARAGVFGQGIDNNSGGDQGVGVTGRFTVAPVLGDERVLHFGAAFSHRDFGDSRSRKFRERPEAHETDVRLVDTGAIADANSMNLFGLESAAVLGPWSLQGEYMHASVNRSVGLSTVDLSGWYAYASWFLTGESRAYHASSGTFGRVHPATIAGIDGLGAWELGIRVSQLDLNDADITGGRQKDLTIGLNWYLTPTVRLMANYVNVLDVSGGAHANDQPGVFQLRGQIDF